jgi:hypothetical protein
VDSANVWVTAMGVGNASNGDDAVARTAMGVALRRPRLGRRVGTDGAIIWVAAGNAPFFASRPKGNQKWITDMKHRLDTV